MEKVRAMYGEFPHALQGRAAFESNKTIRRFHAWSLVAERPTQYAAWGRLDFPPAPTIDSSPWLHFCIGLTINTPTAIIGNVFKERHNLSVYRSLRSSFA